MKKVLDERVIAAKRRINSSAFSICLLALWGILLYRQFVLEQAIQEYLDIFLLTIGISIYVTVNNVLTGNFLTYRPKNARRKVTLIGAIIGSIVFSVTQFFVMDYSFSSINDIGLLALQIFIFFGVWMILQSFILKLSEKQANKDLE